MTAYTGGGAGNPTPRQFDADFVSIVSEIVSEAIGPQVVEVTDLLIPAGTDWLLNPHLLGSFTYDGGFDFIEVGLYLELEEEPVDGIELIANSDGWLSAGTGPGGGPRVVATQQLASAVGLDNPLPIAIRTGPTTAPITVVRARAAFLVI